MSENANNNEQLNFDELVEDSFIDLYESSRILAEYFPANRSNNNIDQPNSRPSTSNGHNTIGINRAATSQSHNIHERTKTLYERNNNFINEVRKAVNDLNQIHNDLINIEGDYLKIFKTNNENIKSLLEKCDDAFDKLNNSYNIALNIKDNLQNGIDDNQIISQESLDRCSNMLGECEENINSPFTDISKRFTDYINENSNKARSFCNSAISENTIQKLGTSILSLKNRRMYENNIAKLLDEKSGFDRLCKSGKSKEIIMEGTKLFIACNMHLKDIHENPKKAKYITVDVLYPKTNYTPQAQISHHNRQMNAPIEPRTNPMLPRPVVGATPNNLRGRNNNSMQYRNAPAFNTRQQPVTNNNRRPVPSSRNIVRSSNMRG